MLKGAFSGISYHLSEKLSLVPFSLKAVLAVFPNRRRENGHQKGVFQPYLKKKTARVINNYSVNFFEQSSTVDLGLSGCIPILYRNIYQNSHTLALPEDLFFFTLKKTKINQFTLEVVKP